MAAPRGNVGTCNVSVSREWDRHSRSVGRSVDAHGPVDHDSVGLAQAHPNYAPRSAFMFPSVVTATQPG